MPAPAYRTTATTPFSHRTGSESDSSDSPEPPSRIVSPAELNPNSLPWQPPLEPVFRQTLDDGGDTVCSICGVAWDYLGLDGDSENIRRERRQHARNHRSSPEERHRRRETRYNREADVWDASLEQADAFETRGRRGRRGRPQGEVPVDNGGGYPSERRAGIPIPNTRNFPDRPEPDYPPMDTYNYQVMNTHWVPPAGPFYADRNGRTRAFQPEEMHSAPPSAYDAPDAERVVPTYAYPHLAQVQGGHSAEPAYQGGQYFQPTNSYPAFYDSGTAQGMPWQTPPHPQWRRSHQPPY